MKSTATVKYLRIAPRKVRLVANLIRGKKADEAVLLLQYAQKTAAEPVRKALLAALASAAQKAESAELDRGNFTVASVQVSGGPTLKRYRPRARGRAYPIMKRTSHVTLILEEIVPSTVTKKAPKKNEKKADVVKDGAQTTPEAVEKKERQRTQVRAPREDRKTTKENQGVKRLFRRKAV